MNQEKSEEHISLQLADAAKKVTVGARYRHYKQRDYTVLAVALREEDTEPCVVYKAEYGENIIWIRPLTSWLEEVEVNGKKAPRFAKQKDD